MRSHKKLIGIVVACVVLMCAGIFYWQHQQPDNKKPSTTSNTKQPSPTPAPQPKSYVDQKIDAMSLRDKVASLFILHTATDDPAALANYAQTYKPGGLIFMGDNIPDTFAELRAQTSALVTDKRLPPFIATDEEGDTVTRLEADTYPGAQSLRDLPPEAAKTAFTERSNLLRSVGINLNFGIDADVTDDPDSFIYPRVLGRTPQAAADRVAQAVIGSEGITLSTIKHFPGHGETGADSHASIPTTSISLADWQQRDAIPFQAGIDAGADMVMFGHLRYTAVDQQPATLSAKWHDIVRNQLGFKGVIITDDMIMLQNSGEAAFTDPVNNAIAAIQAGNDLLLYVVDHGGVSEFDPNTLIDGVVAAVNDGRISHDSLNTHVRAALTMRYDLGRSFYGQQ